MIRNRNCFDIKPILDLLRASIGDSEFGYRMQVLFAHVLLELGHTVSEVNQLGHPDIRTVKNGQVGLYQVKSITHHYAGWNLLISSDDVAGIRPSSSHEAGYFAVIDCATPVSWVVNEYSAIQRHEGCSVSIESIRASASMEISTECSEVFANLLLRHKDSLPLLTFSIMRERVLRGEGI